MRLALAACLLAAALTGCASRGGVASSTGEVEQGAPTILAQGRASWYGLGFHGRQTASGEKFDMNAYTAAHPTLPFGTRVLVRNPANGRSVVVRINDRGPYSGGRIIDVSFAAARALGIVTLGTRNVVLLEAPPGAELGPVKR
ncbi:septal ring lytic transglycosylase RlpA family protein [Ramlibacter sp. MMS24-I3-19]|uniref:septal ring lytic transglycosylase RlpA family protein n=1 Tax=Ramlibacter sp. MMS24-I3-19 TaxID=3416606 RepID=UPI003D01AF02